MGRVCLLPDKSENVNLILNEFCTPGFLCFLPKRPRNVSNILIITLEDERREKRLSSVGEQESEVRGRKATARAGRTQARDKKTEVLLVS